MQHDSTPDQQMQNLSVYQANYNSNTGAQRNPGSSNVPFDMPSKGFSSLVSDAVSPAMVTLRTATMNSKVGATLQSEVTTPQIKTEDGRSASSKIVGAEKLTFERTLSKNIKLKRKTSHKTKSKQASSVGDKNPLRAASTYSGLPPKFRRQTTKHSYGRIKNSES